MLVLTRKQNETIVIVLPNDKTIEIKCVEIRGDKVRLGIQCPVEIPVHRQEVYEAIHAITPTGEAKAAEAAGAYPQPPGN